MEPPSRSTTSPGRPKKRVRSDAEVASLAARLAADWVLGDAVEVWLRRHVDELTDLVRDGGWSWADVGRALDAAGIRYRTGRPWTALMLTRKAKKARDRNARKAAAKAEKARARMAPLADALRAVLGAPVAPAREAPHPAVRAAAGSEAAPPAPEPAGPRFRPAKLRGFAPPETPARVEPAPATPEPERDVDAILAEFMGASGRKPDPEEET